MYYSKINGKSFKTIQKAVLKQSTANLVESLLNELKKGNLYFFDSKIHTEDKKYSDIIIANGLENSFIPVDTVGNGDCLYGAISLNLFGADGRGPLLRFLHVWSLIRRQKFYSSNKLKDSFIRDESARKGLKKKIIKIKSYKEFIKFAAVKSTWSRTLTKSTVDVFSDLLDRRIEIFSDEGKLQIGNSKKIDNKKESIKIASLNNHAVAILRKS